MSQPVEAASNEPRTLSSDVNESPPNGKSPTPSASDAAAAALRDFARGRSSGSKRSSANSSTSTSSFRSIRSGYRDGANNTITPHPTYYFGAIPRSPVSPISSKSLESPEQPSSGSSEERGRSINNRTATHDEIEQLPARHQGYPMPPPPRRIRGRPPEHNSLPQPGTKSSSRFHTPMSYSDLGRDYSRYPPPSRRNSSSNLLFTAAPSISMSDGPQPAPLPEGEASEKPENTRTHIGYITDPEKRASWLLDDVIGAPGTPDAGYPLYMDEEEVDDDMHMPHPDDDQRLKPTYRQLFARDRICSLFGMLFMFLGLCCVFILLPVLSFSGAYDFNYPYNGEKPFDAVEKIQSWAKINDVRYPLLENIRTGLIDPDTPKSAKKRKSFLGEDLVLVFSDEFNTPNRTFYEGDDPFWTAPDFWYGATQDLEWYDPDAVTTVDGTLNLRMDSFINHGLTYRSGMLNSWNQACFKGGALEISVSLPGPGGASGLWPGAWTMGNLGRPGYKASTDGIWPYTYNSCDAGITPNQSMTDGTSYLLGQKLPSCTCSGEDHPTPGTGRGAPEIDVFEASADPKLKLGVITQSYQVAPYDIWYHPDYDYLAFPNYNVTQLNSYCGGPYQQAISGQTELNNKWYDGELYQKYGFEYTPGTGSTGQIAWFVGDNVSYMMSGNAVGPNGNVNSRPISEEPMSIVLNLGISPAWTGIIFEELRFPTTMYVDYVRWYQPADKTLVTCDPPGYETTEYIEKHPKAYNNINLTNWDGTGYGWPKHKLNTAC